MVLLLIPGLYTIYADIITALFSICFNCLLNLQLETKIIKLKIEIILYNGLPNLNCQTVILYLSKHKHRFYFSKPKTISVN